jgi:ABC-type branched-subunit amino acid transport system ATPase component
MVDEVFHRIERAKGDGDAVVLIEQFVHRSLALDDMCVILSQGHWRGRAGPATPSRKPSMGTFGGAT